MLDKKGVSLVEMMVALVILLLVFLALMQTALVNIDANIKNLLRDEAVNIAERRMTDFRNTPFDNAILNSTGGAWTADGTETRNFRDLDRTFTRNRRIADNGTESKTVDMRVTWSWKNENFTHNITTLIRRR